MTSAKRYRKHADKLLKLARTTVNSEERACLVAVAHEWVKLARRLEDQERRETQREGHQGQPAYLVGVLLRLKARDHRRSPAREPRSCGGRQESCRPPWGHRSS